MKRIFIWLATLALLFSCSQSDDPAEKRARRASKAKEKIIVGAAAPWETLEVMLWQGIELAVEEINREGGILGRELEILKRDDEGSLKKGLVVAKRFAENPDMVAVIGHYNSYISVPASTLYEYYGLLMLSPTSTGAKLTGQGLRRVFRIVPHTVAFGTALADFCRRQGYRNMMIYNENIEFGKDLATAFDRETDERGITIQDRLTYEAISGPRNFRKDLRYWKETFTFDAIFLAGTLPEAALFILEARKQGIMVPIVAGGIDSPELLRLLGAGEDNIFIGTTFQPGEERKEVKAFVDAFSKKYQTAPDTAAALGYDAVKTLAAAMEVVGTSIPDRVAETLRSSKEWPGVTGLHIFDEKGDVEGPSISIKRVHQGRFEHFPF